MPFLPPFPIPERIFLYGATGSGKSYAYLSIARALAHFGSPATFHVISTDKGITRMIYSEFPQIAHLVKVTPAPEWDDLINAIDMILPHVAPQDWVVVDLVCKAWDTVQSAFTERVYGRELADYFLDVRAQVERNKAGSGKKGGAPALDGRQDWPTIKTMYRRLQKPLLEQNRCNVLCCAKSKPVDSKLDAPALVEEFSRIGARPAGNKDLPFEHDTSIYVSRVGTSQFWMRTHKDRGRQYLDQGLQDFAIDYLHRVAGWTIA